MALHLLRFWLSAERPTFVAGGTVAEIAEQLHAKEFKSASYSDHNENALRDKELMGIAIPHRKQNL
jgi:hypothetical protein